MHIGSRANYPGTSDDGPAMFLWLAITAFSDAGQNRCLCYGELHGQVEHINASVQQIIEDVVRVHAKQNHCACPRYRQGPPGASDDCPAAACFGASAFDELHGDVNHVVRTRQNAVPAL